MSVRFQADNDLKFAIVKAVRRMEPAVDFASAQATGLHGMNDSEVLELAAADGRLLVTHDASTMPQHFRHRLSAGKSSPGMLVALQAAAIRDVAEALVVIWATTEPDDLRDQVYYVPSLTRHVFRR